MFHRAAVVPCVPVGNFRHLMQWFQVVGFTLVFGSHASAVPIDLTGSTPTVTGPTTLHIEGIAALGARYWAGFDWNAQTNKFDAAAYGELPSSGPFVLIPSGTFVMGDGVAWCGVDERQVTLTHDFWLGQYEVTNQQYLDLVQWAYDRGYVTATSLSVRDNLDGSTEELVDLDDSDCEIAFSDGVFSLRDTGHGLNGDHPMKEVTWYGSVSYCDWLSLLDGVPRAYDHSTWICGGGDPYAAQGYRLPTDAEWEYAAQWSDERIYPWGNENPQPCVHANYNHCLDWTSPVGSYPSGVQPNLTDPIYDLSGNVLEWVNDWRLCDLGTSPEIDPPGPGSSAAGRVGRGGRWNGSAFGLRVSDRRVNTPDFSYDYMGFRVARSD